MAKFSCCVPGPIVYAGCHYVHMFTYMRTVRQSVVDSLPVALPIPSRSSRVQGSPALVGNPWELSPSRHAIWTQCAQISRNTNFVPKKSCFVCAANLETLKYPLSPWERARVRVPWKLFRGFLNRDLHEIGQRHEMTCSEMFKNQNSKTTERATRGA